MTVNVTYVGEPSKEIEDELARMSTRWHGKVEGAGLWMLPPITRDIQFQFPDKEKAGAFKEEAQLLLMTHQLEKATVELLDNDY